MTVASGPHAEVVAYFCAAYERRNGVPYDFRGSTDGEIVKRRLRAAKGNTADVRGRIDALFASDFFANGADLGTLERHWNKLVPVRRSDTLSYIDLDATYNAMSKGVKQA